MIRKSSSSRGGKRLNAGRKTGTGKFREPTAVVRVPASQKERVVDFFEHYQAKKNANNISEFMVPTIDPSKLALPLFSSSVRAGFPSPADDHVEDRLDLNDYLIKQPDATFFVRIIGDSMIDAGIFEGDIAVVDRARLASIGNTVLAVIDGEFTIKILSKSDKGKPVLLPANPVFSPIEIKEGMNFEIWGVVTGTVRKFN
ncbi:MAG: LexA family protein [Methylophilaceae bacterium]